MMTLPNVLVLAGALLVACTQLAQPAASACTPERCQGNSNAVCVEGGETFSDVYTAAEQARPGGHMNANNTFCTCPQGHQLFQWNSDYGVKKCIPCPGNSDERCNFSVEGKTRGNGVRPEYSPSTNKYHYQRQTEVMRVVKVGADEHITGIEAFAKLDGYGCGKKDVVVSFSKLQGGVRKRIDCFSTDYQELVFSTQENHGYCVQKTFTPLAKNGATKTMSRGNPCDGLSDGQVELWAHTAGWVRSTLFSAPSLASQFAATHVCLARVHTHC